jgi:murein DD-endopeptidase MepM/ murein hydrolase activator NlpD
LIVNKKNTIKKARTVVVLVPLVALGAPSAYAWEGFSSITEKIKSIFVQKEEEAPQQTAQTMSIFQPTIVDTENLTASTADILVESSESLQAISGPMRLSTEDVDFPETDEISVYEVKKGDTLQDVAKLFGVSVNTIIWANDLKSKTISRGDTLIILPVTGIKHTVKKGDTVGGLAKKYKADVRDITQYNGISEETELVVGDVVIIPDGEIEVIQPKTTKKATAPKNKYLTTTPSGFLVRPLVGGRKTQGIHGNNAVDIAATPGTPIVASASGRAIVAKVGGYNGGYGNLIIITHANGVQTVYAHLRDVYIRQGETVTQGQVIGSVGNTGRSTGPHLHFEVRGAKNPF